MTDTAVTRFQGVTRRRDSAVWWFVLRAPQDLRERFKGTPWAVRCSLGTSDLRQANDKARALQAEWAARFEAMRREDNPQPVALTPALASAIASEVRRWVLTADDNMRDFPEGPSGLLTMERRKAMTRKGAAVPLRSLLIPDAETPHPLAGLSDEGHTAVTRLNKHGAELSASAMSRRDRLSVQPFADTVARSMGLLIDWQTPEGAACLLEVLKAQRQASFDLVRRDAGEVVDTPAAAPTQQADTAPPPSRQGHTPADALEAWKGLKAGRPRKTVEAYRAASDKLSALLEGKTLEGMTREDGRRVVLTLTREADLRGPKGRNTAANILSKWKTLLAQAVDLEWIDKHPLTGRTIERVPTGRDEWTAPELVTLFADPLFTAYAVPTASMAGKDAAYWLPVLGLFTGARISELAQLGINDVQRTADAGWVLSIHEEGEGQSVKNAGSVRRVPVHPELERLGFIDYWKAVKGLGASRLWPAVVFTELNGAGGKVSQWFSKYKTGKGFGPGRVFHSFRHTLQTRLLALGIPESHADTLAGRTGRGVSLKEYTHLKPADVRPSLERLQFPGLSLPRVFTAPAWKPKAGLNARPPIP